MNLLKHWNNDKVYCKTKRKVKVRHKCFVFKDENRFAALEDNLMSSVWFRYSDTMKTIGERVNRLHDVGAPFRYHQQKGLENRVIGW